MCRHKIIGNEKNDLLSIFKKKKKENFLMDIYGRLISTGFCD